MSIKNIALFNISRDYLMALNFCAYSIDVQIFASSFTSQCHRELPVIEEKLYSRNL